MSLSSEVTTPFRSAALLAAYNVTFAGNGLAALDATFGIQAHQVLIAHEAVPSLPAMAAVLRSRRRADYETGQNLEVGCIVRVWLAFAQGEPASVFTTAALYLDCIRATATTQLAGTFRLFKWREDDPLGAPFVHGENLPTRLVWADFDLTVPYSGRTA